MDMVSTTKRAAASRLGVSDSLWLVFAHVLSASVGLHAVEAADPIRGAGWAQVCGPRASDVLASFLFLYFSKIFFIEIYFQFYNLQFYNSVVRQGATGTYI